MKAILEVVTQAPQFDPTVYLRDADSYYKEWKGHNILYNIYAVVDPTDKNAYRAKHVDLDNANRQAVWWEIVTLRGVL